MTEPIQRQPFTFGFEDVLRMIKEIPGTAIARSGWNGKDLLVKLQRPDENSKMTLPYLYIEYPDGKRCPWLASQTDILAYDWDAFKTN